MSILRGSARCYALTTRLVLSTPQPAQLRTVSTSALALNKRDNPLPATDWGARRKQPNGGASGGPSPGGDRRKGPGSGQPRRDRPDRPDRPRGPRSENGQQDQRRRRPENGQQGGQQGFQQEQRRPRDRDGDRQPNRRPPRDRQERTGGPFERSGDKGPRRGKLVADASTTPDATETVPKESSPAANTPAAFDQDDSAGSSSDVSGFNDRHGRRQERPSRSLLHTRGGELALPGWRHRSPHGGKHQHERHHRDTRRDWVLEGDGAEAEARENLRRIQQEKAKKQQAARKKSTRQVKEQEVDVFIPATISVAQLAEKFGVKLGRLQNRMLRLNMSEDQRRPEYFLNADDASNLAIEFDMNPIIDADKGFDIYPEPEADLSSCPLRPPVVTIMGHVDHGKTTLLDSLRQTSVAAGEAGGITQHIGAFSVPLSSILPKDAPPTDATITFLDTPGHAAFSGMRARGASVTDLVVLVVAADDGVMPQTKEVIELVKAEGDKVGLVVAINKCDKPVIDIDRVKSNLGAEAIHLEEDGGEVPAVRVSGLTRLGLDDLVETLSTLAEIRDLRARTEGKAEGYVLESRVDKGRGSVATVLITRGTLKSGSSIVAGNTWGRVRQMMDSNGKAVREATPGMPVSITGWQEVPHAGDQLLQAEDEKSAKKCIENRLRDAERLKLAKEVELLNQKRVEERLRAAKEAEHLEAAKEAGANVTQALHAARRAADAELDSGRKVLNLVIKGDVSGTVEAVIGALEGIGNKEAGVKIVHTGVGDVSESDVALAEASDATLIGFSVSCPRSIQTRAATANVPLHLDSVIYRLIEAVRTRVAALLPPRIEYRTTGEATVQQIFEIKVGRKDVKVIAGCKVGNGVISKNEGVRVLRGPNRDIVYEGTMETLKHMKKDVTEMRKGTECGIGLASFQDLKEGDEIVTFQTFEVAREL